jgi:hypothetical protein
VICHAGQGTVKFAGLIPNPMQNQPTAPARLLTPGRMLLLAVFAGYCLLALFPVVKRRLGIFDQGFWFLDSYAILASCDAVKAGLDPAQPNPFDLFQRRHSYSGWWFVLGDLGLTREHNFLVGGAWVLAFLAGALALFRPRNYREALLGSAVLLSPPVVLAVNRANNDLVVFALFAAGLLAVRDAKPWSLLPFILALILTTGLKFYAVVASVALLSIRPPKLAWLVTGLSLLAGGLTLATVWNDFRQAAIPAPSQLHTFGVQLVFRDLGWTGPSSVLVGGALLVLGAFVAVRQGWSVRLDAVSGDLRTRLAFAIGATLLVGCFLGAINHSYRLIFVVFLLPQLRPALAGPAGARTLALLLALLWLDGLYCLATNLAVGAMPLAEVIQRQLIWRIVTQPLVWAAMILLAGSLLTLVLWPRPDQTGERTAP